MKPEQEEGQGGRCEHSANPRQRSPSGHFEFWHERGGWHTRSAAERGGSCPLSRLGRARLPRQGSSDPRWYAEPSLAPLTGGTLGLWCRNAAPVQSQIIGLGTAVRSVYAARGGSADLLRRGAPSIPPSIPASLHPSLPLARAVQHGHSQGACWQPGSVGNRLPAQGSLALVLVFFFASVSITLLLLLLRERHSDHSY